jgi:hypothetical protein
MENEERLTDPAEALRAAQETRTVVAGYPSRPRWYSIFMAAYTAGVFLDQLVPAGLARWAILMVLVIALATAVTVRRRASYQPNFWRTPGARWFALLLAAGLFSLLALGYVLESGAGLRWPWLPLGVAAFCWMLYGVKRMERAWLSWVGSTR